ncbi:MAG TPA: hypothetical protein PLM10_03740 [Saccharofermentans sp.]|nr:hypothetical protein [Saccharofermentans sp.]HPE27957.1 hypothetical protein [Saccharofermentans sp.]HRV50915.1 hypothetical protein [Saccharofermentans sp.]
MQTGNTENRRSNAIQKIVVWMLIFALLSTSFLVLIMYLIQTMRLGA